jgi:hypothetical protein
MTSRKQPRSGDLVEVLMTSRDPSTMELDHYWKTGILLEVSQDIDFESLLWVDVLVDGEKVITTPDKIELIHERNKNVQ